MPPDRLERLPGLVEADGRALCSGPAHLVELAQTRAELRAHALEEEIECVINSATKDLVSTDVGHSDLAERAKWVTGGEQRLGGEALLNGHGLESDVIGQIFQKRMLDEPRAGLLCREPGRGWERESLIDPSLV